MVDTFQKKVITKIKDACENLFIKVLDMKVSEKLLSDTQIPALCISELKTIYSQQQDKDVVENYEIKLMIIIKDDPDPINVLSELQSKVISALLNAERRDGITFELKDSNLSNATNQYQFGSGISCVLSVTCSQVVSYNL